MKAVFIGSGNVATHLALALQAKGFTISQVYSRTTNNAEVLANKLKTAYTIDIYEIDRTADIYFYALTDNAFKYFIRNFDVPNALHVHTAGSVSLREFDGFANKYGVFYPLQTFSKNRPVDFSEIPICVEGCNSGVQEQLLEIAKQISNKTFIITSEQRKKLHLAAVFACNFTNYMYDVASMILEDSGVSFEIIKPLILETAEKVQTLIPYEAQTGPAVRYDEKTIRKHLYMLSGKYTFRRMYRILTKNIHKRHKRK
ncbi:MAG: DUF2520 domain-containing protein [Paludibacter sp.]|nr:DUF2520 domain-containing protein [Paludibacter sp.]